MQRIRLLLVAAAVVMLSLFGFARPSAAQDEPTTTVAAETTAEPETTAETTAETPEGETTEETELDHAVEECIEDLEAANSIDVECQAAPNQLMPEVNELLYGGLAFLIVLGFLWKMGMPAIKAGMNARTERIKADLDAAEAQRTEADTILAQYQAQLADARSETARIIEEARQAADEVRAGLQAKAEADIAELRTRALADIEAARGQVSEDLKREVTALAIGAAEQVVGRNLDAETNAALVEAYINQVGANS